MKKKDEMFEKGDIFGPVCHPRADGNNCLS